MIVIIMIIINIIITADKHRNHLCKNFNSKFTISLHHFFIHSVLYIRTKQFAC